MMYDVWEFIVQIEALNEFIRHITPYNHHQYQRIYTGNAHRYV